MRVVRAVVMIVRYSCSSRESQDVNTMVSQFRRPCPLSRHRLNPSVTRERVAKKESKTRVE
jgi:hypothetical protein